jgi:hypothetical protein
MLQGWPDPVIPVLPDNWEAGIPASRALVASFIRARPHLLLQVPRSEEQAGKAWPSPRTWDMAARLLAAATAAGVGEDIVAFLITGCVGEGAGLEFLAWRRDLDLPDPEAILAAPGQFRLSGRGDRDFAILTAVVSAAVRNLDRGRWLAAWEVLSRAAEQGGRDVAAVAARSLAIAKRQDLPLPVKELREFLPLLQKAGGVVE